MPGALWLRFDAPLMSFGGIAVDQIRKTEEHPGASMLTGLLANALGYDHGEFEALERLQARLRFAVREDRRGEAFVDYQTVDLGQSHLVDTGWTTFGRREDRAGASSEGTHIRFRSYLAGAAYTVALALREPEEAPSLDDLASALATPERPLFLGRKACIPATPILMQGRASSDDPLAALAEAPRLPGSPEVLRVWWTEGDTVCALEGRLFTVTDERGWANQVHVGRRVMRQGAMAFEEPADA